ncbi:PLDc N-terminal domain-containing protein [Kitasatospora sp. LaBMicrA B282]|uniref:PLDc N-terminal domain-containing protein n=1 Tax=Kitasatospora sp. LaBMicrA B282 TaxID=3420949 RepID=UPI003D101067
MWDVALFLVVLMLWIWAFVDCLTTPDDEVRYLPKVIWLLLILFTGEVLAGPVAWLLVGKRRFARTAARADRAARAARADRAPEPTPARFVAPDDNPEFLAALGRENERRRREGGTS